MIYCNLSGLIAERHINISTLSKDTSISRTTLTSLYHNNFKGIQTDTLNTLCKYFDVSADKLLVFSKYDISVEFAESNSLDLDNRSSRADSNIYFNICSGKIQKKCGVYCGLYLDWHTDFLYIEPELLYYTDEQDEQRAEGNSFLKKALSSLPSEIKNCVSEMVRNLINSYVGAALNGSGIEIETARVSLNDLI